MGFDGAHLDVGNANNHPMFDQEAGMFLVLKTKYIAPRTHCLSPLYVVYVYIASRIEGLILHPRTEEIVLKINTTAKTSNKFSRESPYISNMFSKESPKFHTSFHVCKRSPRHSKDLTGKP